MKYYSGVEVSGSVTMSDNGEPLPGVRLLIERDAFSGEDAIDLDEDTYWIPIGFTDADENGEWSFHAPAGKKYEFQPSLVHSMLSRQEQPSMMEVMLKESMTC